MGFQKEPMVPGIVDFELIQEELKTSKLQTPSAYRFGRLSHHSFFSRHHPQPQRVTHIQGKAKWAESCYRARQKWESLIGHEIWYRGAHSHPFPGDT